MTPELLCDKNKGLTAMFKAFPAVRFKGKGHEVADLRRLLGKYREWGHTLLPEMEFTDLMEKVTLTLTLTLTLTITLTRWRSSSNPGPCPSPEPHPNPNPNPKPDPTLTLPPKPNPTLTLSPTP